MRSTREIPTLLAMSAAVVLVVVVGVGCGGDETSSRHELPVSPQPVATVAGDGLLPGDRRAPGPAPVTTTAPRPGIGRPLRPVPKPAPATTTTAPSTAPSS